MFQLRPLRPSFLIIGAQKCGTTSLYHYLVQHPLIFPARKKEIHYFDINFHQDINWHLSHFPLLSCEQKTQFFITGEATPYYVFHPLVAKRVFNLFPDIKIILLLRNPVDRAYSHYKHERRLGYETLSSFEKAIEKEEERLKGEIDKIINIEKY